jgi:type VI secretion system secreted protein VgrG
VAASGALLLTRATLRGAHNDDFRVDIVAVPAGEPFRPAPVTPKPLVYGLESATVVGPGTDDIHTDEYGRVRVHFHWDRESGRNEASSCWIPTNQPWAGAGFGGTVIPRVGQEVLVEFLGGDPDRPVVIGRTYTEHQPPPYELPRGKKLTALIGNPTPGMLMGGAMGGVDSQIFELQRGNSPAFTSLTENSIRSSGNTGIADRQREQARNSNLKPNDEFAADLPQDMRTQAGYGDTRNMFVVGDEKDKNLVFMQAQRDLNILAKNNWRTVVGNFRGIAILGNDDLHVRNKQLVSVVDAQLLQVEKDQSIDVTKKRTEDIGTTCGLIVTKHAKIEVKTTMTLKAKKSIVFESDEAIQFRVGSSVVRIDKNAIGLSSKRIDLNPAAVTAKARFEPITDARKAAFEAAARKAMAAKPASQEDRLSQYESSQTNPDLQQAGTDGLNHQMQNGENASTISGNNYAAYRDQLQRGMHTGGRTMSPEMADSTLNQFMAQ